MSMRCIFCLEERPGSEEHVFPLAIGGRLTTDRVCEPCNSALGSRVDSALTDNFLVRTRRAELGLAGNSRTVPSLHDILLGKATLANNPERRVLVTFNKATKNFDIRAIPHATNVIMPDGTKVRQVVVDKRDIDQIPKIIKRERRRHGMPPMSAKELAREVQRCCEGVQQTENPAITHNLKFSFAYLRHALIKIAYELAFLWLGETYLGDPLAAEFRKAICAPDPTSTDRLPAHVVDAEGCEAFKSWSLDKTHHLAYAWVLDDVIAIGVRVFNIYAAVVTVTRNTAQYIGATENASTKLRFLVIDPSTGKMRNTSVMDEISRMALVMITPSKGEDS
jgi:hypothetical protein